MGDFSFPKTSRLLRPGDYAGVFNDVRVRVPHRHFLILASPNDLGRPRLGLVFAKRNLKRAVQRNRVKRVVRETFRHRNDLGAMDIVVLGRRDLATQDNPSLHRIMDQIWQTLARKAARHQAESGQPGQPMPRQSG